MKKAWLFSISILVLLITLNSCKKGDTGPQGPVGSANVIYSEWFTAGTWKKDTLFGIYGFNYNKPAADITQQVLDSGVVLVYGKLLGYVTSVWPAAQVGQLPITLNYMQSGKTQTDTWSGFATAGNLRIRFVNNTNEYNVIATNHQFRYIIIPGGKKGARVAQRSYQEICEAYQIPE